MTNFKIILLILLFAATRQPVAAQEALPLDSLLSEAARNNPDIKASWLQYEASLQKVPQVGGLPDPQASFGFYTKPMAILGGEQVAQLSLMQMFPWFGTLKASKDEASAMAMAKFEAFNAVKADLFYQVQTSWYLLVQLKTEIKLVQENIELLESLEELAMVKFQSPPAEGGSSAPMPPAPAANMNSSIQNSGMSGGGMGTMGGQSTRPAANQSMGGSGMGTSMAQSSPGLQDVLRVKMEILEQRDRVALLNDQLETAKVAFNALLNRDLDTPLVLPDSMEQIRLRAEELALADSILQQNPMLAMLNREKSSYEAMETKAKKMALPMFGVGVNYMLNQEREGADPMMNGMDMVMPMLSVSIPIYGKKNRAMGEEARLMQQANVQQNQSLQNQLRVQSQSLLKELADASRRMVLYKEQQELAQASTQLLLAAFSGTGADFEEVLRMQSKQLDYGFKRVQALTDYNNTVALAEKLMNTTSSKFKTEYHEYNK